MMTQTQTQTQTKTKTLIVVALLCLFVGCMGPPVIPVSDLTASRSEHSARIVRPGDSLYTIAWQVGLDYRELARWNTLTPPYILSPGQRIRLSPPTAGTGNGQVSSTTKVSVIRSNTPSSQPIAAPAKKESLKKQPAPETMQPRKESASIKKWVWPGEGRVVTRFNLAQDENGIDIAGIDGSPVRAAADGKIVYAGTGLRGYGLLLILKHNDTFLSAYAHNRAVMVSEGDQVNAGQVIAEMGQSGAESIQLHFEIRRNGQPVDPQRYLPKK